MSSSHFPLDEHYLEIKYQYILKYIHQENDIVVAVDIPNDYVRPLVYNGFARSNATSTQNRNFRIMESTCEDEQATAHMVWKEYEDINWDLVLQGKIIANSYCIRKGLSRKAQLSIYLGKYILKHQQRCLLAKGLPRTYIVETWDAFADDHHQCYGRGFQMPLVQRLDACLWEIKNLMTLRENEKKMWILKPSATNKGAEVHVVRNFDEVREVVHAWADIREWVVQDYIACPYLFQERKFHIRTYVLAVGALDVYVSQDMLVLQAMEKYTNDSLSGFGHITNTAHQQYHPDFDEAQCVHMLPDVQFQNLEHITSQINILTKEVFEAYRGEFSVFQPLPNCFELYGFDYMVDAQEQVWLLEVNPGPDFKQTGTRLQSVIEDLMTHTLMAVQHHLFPNIVDVHSDVSPSSSEPHPMSVPESIEWNKPPRAFGSLVHVYQENAGYRSKGNSTMTLFD